MFLPTYYISKNRKDLAERAIVQRRQLEAEHAKKCDSAAKYYKDINIKSTFYKNLEEHTSTTTPRVNVESGEAEAAMIAKRKQLFERREKLMKLLSEENEKYMAEIKEKLDAQREKDPWNITQLKEQIEELRKKRAVQERELAEQKTYQNWKLNSPYARDFEAKLFQRDVIRAWEDKKKEQERDAAQREEEKDAEAAAIKHQVLEAKKKAKELEAKRLQEGKMWEEKLLGQMQEVTEKNREAEELKAEEAELMRYLTMLNELREKRNQLLDVQRKRELRIALLKQSKEKIRKMALEVQQELELDQQTLQYLLEMEKRQSEKNILRRKLAMSDIEWMKNAVTEQASLERLREEELQHLYQEEAVRMWNQREAQWEKEKKARDKLMTEVLDGLRKQIMEKIASSLNSQQELLRERESTLRNLDESNQALKQEQRSLMSQRECFRNEAEQLEKKLQPRINFVMPDALRRRP